MTIKYFCDAAKVAKSELPRHEKDKFFVTKKFSRGSSFLQKYVLKHTLKIQSNVYQSIMKIDEITTQKKDAKNLVVQYLNI